MKIKKMLVLLLGMVLMLNMSAICTGASGNASDVKSGEVDKMYSFGLIRDAHVFEMNSNVTRGEAAYAFEKMIGYDTTVNKKDVPFEDIDGNINEKEICRVYASGIMSSVYENKFMPDSAVSYGDVVKAAAQLLGYTEYVVGENADFLTYLRALSNGGAVKNVVKGENSGITWGEFVNFLDDVLDADLMKSEYSGNKIEVSKSDENILNDRMKIYKCKGIMTKNEFSSLDSESAYNSDRVLIGDTELIGKNVNTFEMLGMNMEAWYHMDESVSDDKELLYMTANSGEGEILKVSSENITKLTMGELTYTEGEKKKKETFPKGVYVLYNGVAVNDYTNWKIPCENGSVTLIDNNGDGIYDVLSVINYDECVVYSKGIDKMIYDLHSPSRNIDASDDNIKIYKDGTPATFDDINAYDVISASRTKDGRIVRLIVTNNAVRGEITAVSDSDIAGYKSVVTINGTELYTLESFEKVFNNTIKSGLKGTFYLDFNGNITGFSKGESETVYGYIIKTSTDEGSIDQNVCVKMFTQDGKMTNFKVASKPKLNGESCKETQTILDSLKPSLVIKYKLNEDGEISWIESAFNNPDESDYREVGETAPEDRLRVTYSTKTDKVTYINAVGMFNDKEKVSNKTIFFKVPLDIEETDERFFAVGKRTMLVDAQKVFIQTYASSSDAIENDVCVVFDNTNYNSSSFLKNVPVGFVEKVYTTMSNDGEERTTVKLTGHTGTATLQEYKTGYLDAIRAEKTSITTEFKLQKGDVIRYLQNSQGEIVYAEMLCRLNGDGTILNLNGGHGIIDDYYVEAGYIYKREGGCIAFLTKEPNDSITRNDWKVFDVSKAKVYIFENDKLKKGTTDDIVSYNSDHTGYSKCFLHLMYGQPQALYIYK